MRFLQHGTYGSEGKVVLLSVTQKWGGGGQEFFFFTKTQGMADTCFLEKKNQNSPALPSPFPNMTNNKHFETVYSYLT